MPLPDVLQRAASAGTACPATPGVTVPADVETGSLFLDTDASALEFHRRVFEEAQDESTPLLERLKFLAILGLNLADRTNRRRLVRGGDRLWRAAEDYLARRLRPALAACGIDLPPDAGFTAAGLPQLWAISRIDRPDLRDRPLQPRTRRADAHADPFAAIRAHDILLHHPYDSFQPVVDLIRSAALDPDVSSIAITLYRTDCDSPVADALLEAVRRGKDVHAVVELRASRDEENNARWAAALRRAGAHVTYGLVGYKVHAKLALIVRREGADVRRYVHLSTGNYHAATSEAYTDLALLTCDPAIAGDVDAVFGLLTGRAATPAFRALLVAPLTLRRRLHDLIEREIAWRRRGEPGHLVLKMNALTDRALICQLYRASQAGVRVDLIVRGICRLRPGLPGLSDLIRVRSIVGRFLEHSRAWYFRNGGQGEVFIGSADLRPRNLNRRVEVAVPVTDPALARQVRDEVLAAALADTVKARELQSDGTYTRVRPRPGQRPLSSQAVPFDGRCYGASR